MTNKMVASSFLWKFVERGSAQIFSLSVQIILARLLAPDDFGTLAVLLVFVNISNVLIQKGFATSLVQKQHIEDIDINTIFVTSELLSIILYVVLWIVAPIVENIYATPNLSSYLRIISISLFAGSFYSIENSLLIRNMEFKKMFFSSFISTLISGVLAIVLAYIGMGCWALIWQNVVQQFLLSVLSFGFCRWKIKICWNKKSFDELFGFGSNVLLAEILYTSVENVRTLIIGAKYSSENLAYYDRGQTYPSTAMRSIYDTIGSVLLSVFSKEQNNIVELKLAAEKALGFSFFWISPCFIGFALIAEQFTELLLTEKWLPCVPYMRVFCIYQLGILPYCILRNILYSVGKSKESLYLEIVKSALSLCAVIIGMKIGVFYIALFSTLAVWIATFFYGIEVNKYLEFDLKLLLDDFVRTILCCFVMSAAVLFVNKMIPGLIAKIIIDIVTGIVAYILASVLFKVAFFYDSINAAKDIIKGKL